MSGAIPQIAGTMGATEFRVAAPWSDGSVSLPASSC